KGERQIDRGRPAGGDPESAAAGGERDGERGDGVASGGEGREAQPAPVEVERVPAYDEVAAVVEECYVSHVLVRGRRRCDREVPLAARVGAEGDEVRGGVRRGRTRRALRDGSVGRRSGWGIARLSGGGRATGAYEQHRDGCAHALILEDRREQGLLNHPWSAC